VSSIAINSLASEEMSCQAGREKSNFPRKIDLKISASQVPWNGKCPDKSRYVITPIDQMSPLGLWGGSSVTLSRYSGELKTEPTEFSNY
jgi:hypothetical protein